MQLFASQGTKSSLQGTFVRQHLGELEDHEAPNDVHAAWEEEGPSPCPEGVCVLGNAISQVRHDNLCETTTYRAELRSKTNVRFMCVSQHLPTAASTAHKSGWPLIENKQKCKCCC